MAIFRPHLASKQEILLVFVACVFPIHVWSILNMLRELPAWLMRLNYGELIGAFAYTLAFALFESLLFLLLLVVLAAVLPGRLFREQFVAQGTSVVLLSSLVAVTLHYNADALASIQAKQIAIWAAAYLGLLLASALLIRRHRRLEHAITAFAQQLVVLSFIYVLLDLVGVAIVVLRNV